MVNSSATGNAVLVREYQGHLRVERGLRPLSCEAYRRDLEQFAEFVEGENATLMTAKQEHVSGWMQDKRMAYDPTVNIESPASWKVLPKSLAEGEVEEMLARTGAAARSEAADGL